MRSFRIWFLVLLALVLALPAAAERKLETPPAKVMIVLDASGSMRGKVGGKVKMAIARAVIRDLMKSLDPNIRLGLSAYGHRRKGDCKDIQTLIPVGKVDRRAIVRAVDALKPKGKTPLSEAVRRAAEELKYEEDPATVILVTDGKETCGADPCALGKTLKEAGVDFTTHVIGFGVKKSEEPGLRCLAKNTGGIYVGANGAKDLEKSLQVTIKKAREKAEKPKPKLLPGVRMVALYAEGGPEYKGQVNWYIYPAGTEITKNTKPLAEKYRGKSGHVFRKLAPGKYLVLGIFSDHTYIRKRFEIEVKAGEAATHKFVFNVGSARFDGLVKEGGEAYTGQINWNVQNAKADLSGKRAAFTDFYRSKSGGIFLLPAGKWHVQAVLSDANYVSAAKDITVEPAGEDAHVFVFNIGSARFDAKLSDGGAALRDQINWRVLALKADLSGKRQQVTSAYRSKSGVVIVLPAGKWLVTAQLSESRHVGAQQEIEVTPGGGEAHMFVFGAGRVRVDVTVNGAPPGGTVAWDVLAGKADLSGKRKKITGVYRAKAQEITVLKAGNYFIRGYLPDKRTVVGEAAFSIAAGEEKAIKLDLKAK